MLRRVLLALFMLMAPALALAADPKDPVTRAYRIEAQGLKATQNVKPPWFEPHRQVLLSKRLAALFARDEKYGRESEGVGLLDWDPFINGQDGELKGLAIRTITQAVDKSTVEATFVSFRKRQSVMFDLVTENGGWRIDDIRPRDDKGARTSIAELLAGPHECGSGTGKSCQSP